MESEIEVNNLTKETGSGIIRKDNIFDKLNKRNKDLQNFLETRLEQRIKDNQPYEEFIQQFSDRVKAIEFKIINAQPNKNTTELTRYFAGISNDIQELQRYLSQSTMLLPDFNVKACQKILNDLTTRSEEIRIKLIPKKKFGFSKTKIATTTPIKEHDLQVHKNDISTSDNNKNNSFDKTDSLTEKKILVQCPAFDWTISKRQNEYILLVGTDVDCKDLTISNLENCLVEIRGHAGSLQISNAKNCTFLCGPIARSLFAINCLNCTFVAACQQLRLHSSKECQLWLHVTCRAIIEDCKLIKIGEYNYNYSGIDIDFAKSGLDVKTNNYRDIADFNWLSPHQPSPNWTLISEKELSNNWYELKEKFKEDIKL